jgi:hypothetical protein
MSTHTANTHPVAVPGLSSDPATLASNIANSTRVLSPPAITTTTTDPETAEEQFVDHRDIASMILGSSLNLLTNDEQVAFFNPRANSLTQHFLPPSLNGKRIISFAEPRPLREQLGWQQPRPTPSAVRPPTNTYSIKGIPGQSLITVENVVPVNPSQTRAGDPITANSSAFDGSANQGDEYGSAVFVKCEVGGQVITRNSQGLQVDSQDLIGLNIYPGGGANNIFGVGANPEWEPGMHIRESGPPRYVTGELKFARADGTIFDFTEGIDQPTTSNSNPTRQQIYQAASFMVGQRYLLSEELNSPIQNVEVTLGQQEGVTPSFLSFGPDTQKNALRLHDMIFGDSADTAEEKSVMLTMNTMFVNAATNLYFGNTREVDGVIEPADPAQIAYFVSWSTDLAAANFFSGRLQGVLVSSNAATTQYQIRVLAQWIPVQMGDGFGVLAVPGVRNRIRFSIVDRESTA